MKIPKEVYRYAEYEMYHYTSYKRELSAPPEKMRYLNEFQNIKNMADVTKAIDNALLMLNDGHRRLFHYIYLNGRKDIYGICMDLGISDRTYWNYKKDLVNMVAVEMGMVPLSVCNL
ncbi:MAG: hypothetical protein LBU94_00690 [Clostridiales bacterium]|jgi:hypothetical protein|nr:hypothetical protein [Clostridiales bacterium]